MGIRSLRGARHGHVIVLQPDTRQRLVPVVAQYLIELGVPDDTKAPSRRMRGIIHLSGEAESFLARTWRRLLKVLVQESGA